MGRLTIVVGLPGSGKTHYLRTESTGCPKVFDDFLARDRYSDGGLFAVLSALRDGGDCVIDEAGFCDQGQRDGFVRCIRRLFPGLEIEMVYFAPDVGACLRNLLGDYLAGRRTDHYASRVEWCLKYARVYRIPDGFEARPVPDLYRLTTTR